MKKAFLVFSVVISIGVQLWAAEMKKDVVMPAEGVKWQAGPAAGTYMAPLWGDMNAGGAYGALVKFDAGVMQPVHWHTQDLHLVVISGTFLHQAEGNAETRLGPGSYLMQSANAKHISGCAPEAECRFFMTSSGKFDMMTIGGQPAPSGTEAAPGKKKKKRK